MIFFRWCKQHVCDIIKPHSRVMDPKLLKQRACFFSERSKMYEHITFLFFFPLLQFFLPIHKINSLRFIPLVLIHVKFLRHNWCAPDSTFIPFDLVQCILIECFEIDWVNLEKFYCYTRKYFSKELTFKD